MLPKDAAGKDYDVMLAFKVVPVPARRNAPAVQPLAAEKEIRFQAVRLVLDTKYEASERTLTPVPAPANAAPGRPRTTTTQAGPAATVANRIPFFELHIRPMMRVLDRENMITVVGLDLWNYDQVKAQADNILLHITTDMPPASYGGPWPQEWIDLFGRWKSAGFPKLGLAQVSAAGFTASRVATTVTITGTGTLPDGNDRAWLQPVVEEGKPRSYVLYLEPAEPGTTTAPPRGFRVRTSFDAPASLTSITVTDAAGDHVVAIPEMRPDDR